MFSRLLDINLCLMAVFLKEMEQIRAAHEDQRLVLGELVRIWPVVGRGDQDSLGGPFIQDRPVEVSDRRHAYGVRVTLCLNDDLSAANGVWIEGDGIHSAIPARLCDLHFAAT